MRSLIPRRKKTEQPGKNGGALMPFEGFDRLFDRFFQGWPQLWRGLDKDWRWGLDVKEEPGKITVEAEAPGFEPGDFDLQIRGRQLILKASRKLEKEEREKGYFERSHQEFYRTVPLPEEVDPEKVEAHYKNGVLTLVIPRTGEAKAKKIAIKG
jgi:HSP20 family protein